MIVQTRSPVGRPNDPRGLYALLEMSDGIRPPDYMYYHEIDPIMDIRYHESFQVSMQVTYKRLATNFLWR